MKKKLYFSIFFVLLPSILYIIFFYLNDPHGYFGRNDHIDNASKLIDNMLDWRNGEYDAVLIGDSRMTSFNEDYISALNNYTGYSYKNMSYGGAMGTEMNYLSRWCIQQKPIKSIIIVTGWYNFNELLQQNRVRSTEKIIETPLTYAFSIDNMRDMFSNILLSSSSEEYDEVVETEIDPEEKEEHLKLVMGGMYKYLSAYTTDESVINELISICEYCNDNDIEIRIVVPPWIDRFYKELSAFGQYDMDEYKQKLSGYVDIYDMEFEGCVLNENEDDFSDYSHFHNGTYDRFSEVLIYGEKDYSRLWIDGAICQ